MSEPIPIPPDESIFYIPGHINLVVQHEGDIPADIHDIMTDLYDLVSAMSTNRFATQAPIPAPVVWTIGSAPPLADLTSADTNEKWLPVSMLSWNLDDWSALRTYEYSGDQSLQALTQALITFANGKLSRLMDQGKQPSIINARCLPGYAIRSEGGRFSPMHEIQHGTGGCAAFPIPYPGLNSHEMLPIKVKDRNKDINKRFRDLTGQGVSVAVVDTAFSSLDEIKGFVTGLGLADQWLYKDLLYENPIVFAGNFVDPDDEIYYTNRAGKGTLWRSHGFNVASLIRQTAPKANIRLYRVLNDYGIGTLQSILRGLQKAVIDMSGSGRGVVNCSFTLSENRKLGLDDYDTWRIDREFVELLFRAITYGQHHLTFIGAAGNDGNIQTATPPFRYPAAARDFSAVSALNFTRHRSKGKPPQLTYYSNTSAGPFDRKIGLAVFGGEAEAPVFEEKVPVVSNKGVVAAHIEADFYKYDADGSIIAESNRVGFAHLAGTSFSAAIASGLCALLLSSNPTPENKNPIRVLQAAKEDPDNVADQGVRVIQKALRRHAPLTPPTA